MTSKLLNFILFHQKM